ncbi:MAG: ion transporter [Planctomycetes bacterium]|nr:ion transporter [Planctomycetota bacterium]
MAPPSPTEQPARTLRARLHEVIFGIETPAGRAFDVVLIWAIVASVIVVVLDSVVSIRHAYGALLVTVEWVFTVAFTLEYLARLYCSEHRWRYARSFFGLVDLLAVLPTYVALLGPTVHVLVDVRVLRLLRIFRVLRLGKFVDEFGALGRALAASRHKIFVFLFFVVLVVLLIGTLMYVVEGPQNGFTSIPVSVYWAITTMTTVGFGDITPHTDVGRFIASLMMLLGWGTLAVPTGIVSSEFTAERLLHGRRPTARRCGDCTHEEADAAAQFCRYCGTALPVVTTADATDDPRTP